VPRIDLVRSCPVERTARVMQVEGMFDMRSETNSVRRWSVDLPIDDRPWNIGLIVGPSGCGKSSLAERLFGPPTQLEWPESKSIVDAFPSTMGIRDVTGLLSSVGFSSPPAWLRPYRALSTGEQFRASLARALAESPELAVVDEFTSVVDRTVAQIGSAAVARAVRASGRKLVAVACHYDIIDWLQPDWLYDPSTDQFTWRCLQRRPQIQIQIQLCHNSKWSIFSRHHYLSAELNKATHCYVATIAGRDAAFVSVGSCVGKLTYWRAHRVVCLPDFQGVGIGNAVHESIASAYVATSKRYNIITSHPAMVRHMNASPLWSMYRGPRIPVIPIGNRNRPKLNRSLSTTRTTAGFWFVGEPNREAAQRFGLIKNA